MFIHDNFHDQVSGRGNTQHDMYAPSGMRYEFEIAGVNVMIIRLPCTLH